MEGKVTVDDTGVRVSWRWISILVAAICVFVAVPTSSLVTTSVLLYSGVANRAEAVCPDVLGENPWGFSLVIKPDGTYSYYVRDTGGELGEALIEDVLRDAAALHANTGG